MTRIKKLVVDGFKSFAKRTELVFDQPFNVILGANGSGKSNVMDALCFVLGKSSSKAMRAEKSANLIYNGGKTKKPASQAEVSIVFDNSTRTFPLEEDELKITRIVRADGASKYKINGKTHTRSEVLDTLNHANIDPNGYNIILQGDIIRIVEMSPLDRRGIIEEIAGIAVYDDKKNKAINELEKVEEKIGQAEIILKERETYLKDLKNDRDQAQKYKDLNDRIKQNKATYLKIQIDAKEEQQKKIDERHGRHQQKLTAIQSSIEQSRALITQHKVSMKKISDEIESKGEIEQVKLQREIEKLKVDRATKQSRIQSCEQEIKKSAEKKEHVERNLGEIHTKITALRSDEDALIALMQRKRDTITEIEQKVSAFRQKHKLDADKTLELEIDKLDEEAELLEKQASSIRERQQTHLREQDRIEFQIQTIDEKIAKVLEIEKGHRAEIEALKRKKDEFKKTVVELNNVLNDDSKDASTLGTVRREVQELREKFQTLELKQAGIREAQSSSIATKKILENKNKLGTIYNIASELGSVDDKYATALEIAAGARINSVVVEDDKTAATCIQFLKQARLGVVTFLPLNKIRGEKIPSTVAAFKKERGVHGFAVDLVKHDSRFKPVFEYLFGATLVVDSIDVARRIGIGNAKMVTIDGDLAETSGAMKGGYHQQKAVGRFKGAQIQKELDELQHALAGKESDMGRIESKRKEGEEHINRLREFKATLEGEIIKAEKSLHMDSDDLSATNNHKQELRTKLDEVKTERTRVEQDITTLTRNITQLKIKRQDLKNQIAQLRNPTLIAELNAYEQKKKELEREHIEHESEQKRIQLQRSDVHERDSENSKRILKELSKEHDQFHTEITHLREQIKTIDDSLIVKEADQAQFYKQFKELFEQRNKLQDEVNSFDQQILKHEESARGEELAMNSFSIELARIKAEVAGLLTEFEQYHGIELDRTKTEAQLKKEIGEFERIVANIGNVNMRALEIYDKVKQEYDGLVEKKCTLQKEKEDVRTLMEEIEKKKKDLFMDAFEVINTNFKSIFSRLSTKGDAYLKLEHPDDPLADGMEIKVRLTGNKFLDIRSLSGGEKTLTALAFIFAIQEHNPAQFYLLDEVDAALDKQNASLLGELIQKYCEKAQYIVISHNDQLIRHADALYGVTLTPGLGESRVVSLKV